MFGLIRRISYSVIPRPDRPWEDDPTSNAPNTRRKRRISSTERDGVDAMDEEQTRKKKLRGDSEIAGSDDIPSSPIVAPVDEPTTTNENSDDDTSAELGDTTQREGSLEFKAVTEGVKEVELEDKEANTDTNTADEDQPQSNEPAGDLPSAKTSTAEEAPDSGTAATTVKPEAVPLPEEKAGELDEEPSSSSTPGSPQPQEESTEVLVESPKKTKRAPKTDNEPVAESPSKSDKPRITAPSSRSSTSSTRKIRSKSPKKVSARA